MHKQEIKNILMNLRTLENESQVNYLLVQIDIMSEQEISKELSVIGNNKEKISDFFQQKLIQKFINSQSEKNFQ